MRHRNSGRRLGRTGSHQRAMFRNMSASLLRHEAIKTTVPKAKELRRVVEPLITLAKRDSVANRRLAFARLRDRQIVTKLFNDIGRVTMPQWPLSNWWTGRSPPTKSSLRSTLHSVPLPASGARGLEN